MDKEAAHKAMKMLLSGEYSGAKEVARVLHARGLTSKAVPLSSSTIVRHAKAIAKSLGKPIAAVQGAPKKALSASTKLQRLAFSTSNIRRTWRNVMFTDRKKFVFTYPGACINKVSWVLKGQQRVANKSNHALCVNLYAGVTAFGMTKPHIVAGTSKSTTSFTNKKGQQAKNITSAEYEDVVLTTLLPEGKRIMSAQGITTWVLLQENDPTHKRASAQALNTWRTNNPGQNVTILQACPPNRPDLSPIENVWAYVQGKVNKLGCKTFEDFQQNVLLQLQQTPKVMIRNLFESITARLQESITKGGDKTHY